MRIKKLSFLIIILTLQSLAAFSQVGRLYIVEYPEFRILNKDNSRIGSLLDLARKQMVTQSASKAVLDSAQIEIKLAIKLNDWLKSDKYRGVIAWTQVIYFDQRKDMNKVLHYANVAIPYLSKAQAYNELGDTYFRYSRYISYDNYRLKIKAVNKAQFYFQRAGNDDAVVVVQLLKANYALLNKEYRLSNQEAKKLRASLMPGRKDKAQAMVLLQLAGYHIRKPLQQFADLDSARLYIDKAVEINTAIKDPDCTAAIFIRRAEINDKFTNNRQARFAEIHKGLKALSKFKSNANALGDLNLRLAQFYSYDFSPFQTVVDTSRIALQYYRAAGQEKKMGDAYFCMGVIYNDYGKFVEASDSFQQALTLYKVTHSSDLAIVYHECSIKARQKSDYSLSLSLGLLSDASIVPSTPYYIRVLNTKEILLNYIRLKMVPEAIAQGKKSSDMAVLAEDFDNYWFELRNWADFLAQNHQAAKALEKLRDALKNHPPSDIVQQRDADEAFGMCLATLHLYKEAIQFMKDYEKGLKYPYNNHDVGSTDDYAFQAYGYLYLTRFYAFIGNLAKAKQFRKDVAAKDEEGMKHYPKIQYPFWRIEFSADTLIGDYPAAIRHYQLFEKFRNVVFNSSQTKALEDLNNKYATEARIKDVTLLGSQNEIQINRLKAITFQKKLAIVAISVVFVIILLISFIYQAKQRSNRNLEMKQLEVQNQNTELAFLLHEKDRLLTDKEVLIKEKEILMSEVQHRVKDNLQLIGSLLESQSSSLGDEALQAIQKSQHRIQAIALAQQKLYADANEMDVAMDVYLKEIITYLQDSIMPDQNITFYTDIAAVTLSGSQAVPLGLIVNETITNSIKHAFTNRESGRIDISFVQNPDNILELRIADDGVGLPAGREDQKRAGSIGLSLIKGLARTINAEIFADFSVGTTINLRFLKTG